MACSLRIAIAIVEFGFLRLHSAGSYLFLLRNSPSSHGLLSTLPSFLTSAFPSLPSGSLLPPPSFLPFFATTSLLPSRSPLLLHSFSALCCAFDFEWTNKTADVGSYKPTISVFSELPTHYSPFAYPLLFYLALGFSLLVRTCSFPFLPMFLLLSPFSLLFPFSPFSFPFRETGRPG